MNGHLEYTYDPIDLNVIFFFLILQKYGIHTYNYLLNQAKKNKIDIKKLQPGNKFKNHRGKRGLGEKYDSKFYDKLYKNNVYYYNYEDLKDYGGRPQFHYDGFKGVDINNAYFNENNNMLAKYFKKNKDNIENMNIDDNNNYSNNINNNNYSNNINNNNYYENNNEDDDKYLEKYNENYIKNKLQNNNYNINNNNNQNNNNNNNNKNFQIKK